MRRTVKRWKSAPSRHGKVGDAVLYKPLKVKLDHVDQEKPRIEDFDPFPPTCSSSEDHDRISPPHEPTFRGQDPLNDDFVRFRGDSVGGSMRDYSPRDTQPNHISYNGKTASTCSTPLPASFVPQSASTPKSDKGSPTKESERPVVGEGEKRTFVREKDERLDKAMSIYENVSQAEVRANESTVWYEYGCV
ncbi:hypothetical protein Aduo_017201 [Ancylostoma duodenale]